MTLKLPKHSTFVYADDPSEEYPYTWLDLRNMQFGQFYKTEQAAIAAANENFHSFPANCQFKAVIIRCTKLLM